MEHYRIFDAHCDTLSYLLDKKERFADSSAMLDGNRMKQYGEYNQIFACFISPEYRSCALERCLNMIDLFHSQNINGILSIEGAEMITSVPILHTLCRLGIRIIALTWNHSNHLAGGADDGDPTHGLSKFGKVILHEMNRLNVFIDVSHLNDRSFYDVANLSSMPIIATHSNSRTVCNHRRNLTDDMFERIKNSGGCVGINFYPPFLSEQSKVGIDDIVRHIEHFMSLGGENHIGIGADFDGTDGLMPDKIQGCQDTYKLFDRLAQLNYSELQIEKISHKNFKRLFMTERK